jgi:uncharacterized membrane protein YhiD involved in acid resistance
MTEWEGLLRLAIAAAIGGAIGFERETLEKSAGLRTHMLVCMGAALFMVASILLTYEFRDGPPGLTRRSHKDRFNDRDRRRLPRRRDHLQV